VCVCVCVHRYIHIALAGFHAIDIETGNVLNVYVPLPAPRNGITPHAIIQLPEEDPCEYMVSFDGARGCCCAQLSPFAAT
jgi:hypothetical protein